MSNYTPLRDEKFAAEMDGKPVRLYTLQNAKGMTVRFTNLGAKVLQIVVPDRNGVMDDVALGYETLAQVIEGQTSMGAFIGRFANRIDRGRFSLDGIDYRIKPNSGEHVLHGGEQGSRTRVFDVLQTDKASARLAFRYLAAEDGFPGNLISQVTYSLTEDNALSIEYEGVCDQPTVVNMTSHIFFNLAGERHISAESLLNHQLMLNAAAFTPVRADQIPTGEIRSVEGTPLDFRQEQAIGARVNQASQQHEPHSGYDHNLVVNKAYGELGLAARLSDPLSGRVMEVYSTEPGIVFYSGNNLTGRAPRDVGKGGVVYTARSALCLEPGHFPDSPNHANFPSTVLRPGERFSGKTVYRFLAKPA
jgi:aldose 1-epimerase